MKKLIIMTIITLSLSLALADMAKDPPYSTVSAAGVTLNYRVTADLQNLDCQLIATTAGWVGVGFSPGSGMQSANFIIGYHSLGQTSIRDDWGTSATTHASDTSLGGTNNILSSSSTEVQGVTQLNFIIPLNSGDSFDRVLVIGQTYNIILGRGINGGDSFTAEHAAVGAAQITISEPVSNQDDYLIIPVFEISSYPNPFNSEVNISLTLNKDSQLKAGIYNTKGQRVKTLQQSAFKQGDNNLVWNGRDDNSKALPDGIYFLQVSAEGVTQSHKLILIKTN